MSNIIDVLHEFSYKLQEISPRPIENMEIILPYDNYKQLEYELMKEGITKYECYLIPKIKYEVCTNAGIKFKISCKELNDAEISTKLQECFKILSK